MHDRETAIKGLENLRETIRNATQYTFTSGGICAMNMKRIDNAIELLKERNDCENCTIAIEDRQLVVRCKDCINCVKEPNGELYCDILADEYEPLGSKKVSEDWFCADGKRR